MNEKYIKEFEKEIEIKLEKKFISGRYLLDRFCVIDEASRKTSAYLDPKYAPFYYYLGKFTNPSKMIEIGFDLGLLSASFLTSCNTVNYFFGFKEKEKEEFIPNKIGYKNIKKVYKNEKYLYCGKIYDSVFLDKIKSEKWDLVIINEEKDYDKQLQYMEILWPHMEKKGIMIVDYMFNESTKNAVNSFSKKENINIKIFKTRYITAALQKE